MDTLRTISSRQALWPHRASCTGDALWPLWTNRTLESGYALRANRTLRSGLTLYASDALFTLGRWAAFTAGVVEEKWPRDPENQR